MADFDETSRDLSAYLDGELGQADARRLDEALEGSSALRQELAELRALRALLLAQDRPRAGSALTARIVAAAEQLQARGELGPGASLVPRWSRRLAVAAVLVMAAGAGVMVSMNWLASEKPPVGPEIATTDPPPGPLNGGLADTRNSKGLKLDRLARHRGRESGPADVVHEEIVTDNLEETQRDVENVLLSNGLRPDVVRDIAKIGKGSAPRDGGNTYRFSQRGAETISYDVLGSPEQVTNVRVQLSRIRGLQSVDEAPSVAMKALAPAPPTRPSAKPGDPSTAGSVSKVMSKGECFVGTGGTPGPTVAAGAKDVARKPEKNRSPKAAPGGHDVRIASDRDGKYGGKGFMAELSEMLSFLVGGRARGRGKAPQATSGPVAGQQKKEILAVHQGEDKSKQRQPKWQDDRTQSRQEAAPVKANVQRLVITVNKTVLTREGEARRAAAAARAADRSPPAAKE